MFSTRTKLPNLLDGEGSGCHGQIVSFGEWLYRCLDAMEQLREEALEVGLVNKATLNVVDGEKLAELGRQPFVSVVESFNRRTGLGSRYGTWLLERGYTPRFSRLGTCREGCGGLWEQFPHQGIDSAGIFSHVRSLLA